MAAEHVERIGARIRARREELGLSRGKLVERMQGRVKENDLYRWERGQHRPSDDTLEDLAQALNCDVSQFLVDEPTRDTGDLMRALNGGGTQLDRIERTVKKLSKAVEGLAADNLRLSRALEALRDTDRREEPGGGGTR